MSIISSSLISDNLNFAVANMKTTLTAVTPTNSETYVANKQDMEVAFDIFEDGREVTIDTRFYLNKTSYTDLPTKGMILTDGTTQLQSRCLLTMTQPTSHSESIAPHQYQRG